MKKKFTSADFRKELKKWMPGFEWTVHRQHFDWILEATGIQSKGFNRIGTLWVQRSERDGKVFYAAKIAGHGTRSPWVAECLGQLTLRRALRQLQDECEWKSQNYGSIANMLQEARPKKDNDDKKGTTT